jgi:hypothetical protein
VDAPAAPLTYEGRLTRKTVSDSSQQHDDAALKSRRWLTPTPAALGR